MKLKVTRLCGVPLVLCCALFAQQKVGIVAYVKAAVTAGAYSAADTALQQYRAAAGTTPEYIEAFSWIGRGQLARHDAAAAEKNAAEVRKLCLAEVAHRRLDAEPHLPIALGASIEVEAQALAAENRRDEAVLFLDSELKKWQGTSVQDRIQKNFNLLTLEGKPVPVLTCRRGSADASRCLFPRIWGIRCCCFSGRTGVRTARMKSPLCRS